jgi:hypothetical protein
LQLEDDFAIRAHRFENYSVEQVEWVRKLGNQLVAATENAKHHFRSEWVEDRVKQYSSKPGKPIVHLDDLSDTVMPILDNEARGLITVPLSIWVKRQDIARAQGTFGNVASYARDTGYKPAKLRAWRGFSASTGFRVNALGVDEDRWFSAESFLT